METRGKKKLGGLTVGHAIERKWKKSFSEYEIQVSYWKMLFAAWII